MAYNVQDVHLLTSRDKDRKLKVYLPAGRQVPKLGFVCLAEDAADKRYVDEDILLPASEPGF